jgi:hypothetical protein
MSSVYEDNLVLQSNKCNPCLIVNDKLAGSINCTDTSMTINCDCKATRRCQLQERSCRKSSQLANSQVNHNCGITFVITPFPTGHRSSREVVSKKSAARSKSLGGGMTTAEWCQWSSAQQQRCMSGNSKNRFNVRGFGVRRSPSFSMSALAHTRRRPDAEVLRMALEWCDCLAYCDTERVATVLLSCCDAVATFVVPMRANAASHQVRTSPERSRADHSVGPNQATPSRSAAGVPLAK